MSISECPDKCSAEPRLPVSGWVLVLAAMLTGCGGGSADTRSDAAVVGGEEVIVTEPRPVSSAVTTNTRNLAIEVMESIDTLTYLASSLPGIARMAEPGSSPCDGGGTKEISVDATRSVDFSACRPTAGESAELGGVLSYSNDDPMTVELISLTVSSGARVLTVSGTIRLAGNGESLSLSSDSLTVDDSQSVFTLSDVVATDSAGSAGSGGGSTKVTYTLSSPRFAQPLTITTPTSLEGETPHCPDDGTVIVSSVNPDGELSISGADGENLFFSVAGVTDTLACSEIGSVGDVGSNTPVFRPPPPPGP